MHIRDLYSSLEFSSSRQQPVNQRVSHPFVLPHAVVEKKRYQFLSAKHPSSCLLALYLPGANIGGPFARTLGIFAVSYKGIGHLYGKVHGLGERWA